MKLSITRSKDGNNFYYEDDVGSLKNQEPMSDTVLESIEQIRLKVFRSQIHNYENAGYIKLVSCPSG